MHCRVCGANTRVIKTREILGGQAISRRRECDSAPAHFFTTIERVPGYSLDEIRVRQSGSRELSPSAFDRDRVHRDVAEGVLKRLSAKEIAEAVDEALADLEHRLPTLLNRFEEKDRVDHGVGWIWDGDITSAVEAQLERRDRMAAVLYALVIRGRRDRKGRPGWVDASGVLEWLPSRFTHLDTTVTPGRPTPVQPWYPPSDAPRPERIVKRVPDLRQGATSPIYDHGRFVRSIEKALAGRVVAKTKSEAVHGAKELSQLIAEWVLWGVAGQKVILTSQLSVGVLDALRRIDDVAYLRWASIAKRMGSVSDFVDEVKALIEQPSPRLRFDEYALVTPPMIAMPLVASAGEA